MRGGGGPVRGSCEGGGGGGLGGGPVRSVRVGLGGPPLYSAHSTCFFLYFF